MNLLKKIVTIATIGIMIAGPAMGATIEDLQAQIDTLLAQLATLQSQLADLQGEVPAVEGCAISSFDRNLSQGMSGDDVKCLQIVLNSDSDTQLAASGVGSPGNETSYFGPLTKAAVIKFQEKYADEVLASWGLTAGTGFVGSTTRAKLDSLLAAAEEEEEEEEEEVVIPGEGLAVSLAADTPVAATIVADSTTNDGAQAMVPVLALTFANGDESEVKVTQLSFKRGGISADSDISQAYLTGSAILAEYNSFSSGVLTFLNSAGLFTIPAGGSKTVTLKIDLANGTASGKTIRFSVESSSNIASDASSVSGDFPMTGNTMSTAIASDLGKLTVATSTPPSATVDPQDNLEVFNFTMLGSDQVINVYKLVFTNIGSTAASDLNNFRLFDGGTQVGDTVDSMASNKTITFDFSGSPMVIGKGITKVMHLRADIVGGTNRTFQFSIQNMSDISAYDTQYGVYIKPNASAWAVLSTAASTINTGRLTLTRASASPSGNVPTGGTNVTVAKFDVKAVGEDAKITSMVIRTYGTLGTSGLYQMKVYFDGAQKGVTGNASSAATDIATGDTTFTFGNTFIVPAGTVKTLEIKADIRTQYGTTSPASTNFTVKIQSFAAQGRTSLATVASSMAAGYQLTIAAGTLTVAKNGAIPDWNVVVPTGVPGASEAMVGAFVITGGAAEGADITAIKIKDDGALGFPNLQNLKVYNGIKQTGTQIGSTQSSLTTGSSYSFYPSPYISLAANQQLTIFVYADIMTPTSTASLGYVTVDEVNGTGQTTNTSVDYTADTTGQAHFLASAGVLVIAAGDDTPRSANIVAGTANVSFTQVKFTAGAGEAIGVTQFVVTGTLTGAASSTLNSISLWDGTTQVGQSIAALNSVGTATFDLSASPWLIPAGDTKNLMVKSSVSLYPYSSSAGSVSLTFPTSTITYKGMVSGVSATNSVIGGNAMYTYKTVITAAPNASTPSGSAFPSANQHVLYLDVTNTGGYVGYLNGVTTTVSYTVGAGNTTTSALRTFNIYDVADLTTSLGSATTAASTTINGMTLTFNLTTAEAIAAGTTKTFYIIGDTSDCAPASATLPASRIQFYINDGTDFNWDDAVSTAVQTTRTKTFPLYGGTLVY